MIWSDNTARCSLSAPPSKGKRVVICHAGSSQEFLPNALVLFGKQLSELYADFYVPDIMKEEKTFHEMDHISNSEIKPLIFQLSYGGDSDYSDAELVWTK